MQTLVLTEKERSILDSYCHMIEDLAAYLGSGFEFALHSLENYDHSVIKIINGYHTGRKEGAPITDLALDMLGRLEKQSGKPHGICYYTENRKGEPLKSTTIPILGENDRIIGLLCINFYLNTPLNDLLSQMLHAPAESVSGTVPGVSVPVMQKETFADSAGDLVTDAVRATAGAVRADISISESQKNKEIIRRLHQKGVFSLKGSVEMVAEQLGISVGTVYLHLRTIEKSLGH